MSLGPVMSLGPNAEDVPGALLKPSSNQSIVGSDIAEASKFRVVSYACPI